LLSLLFAFVSCGEDKPVQHFRLSIETKSERGSIIYDLSDTMLLVHELYDLDVMKTNSPAPQCFAVKGYDTLALIALLDMKTYDCKEQHVLDAISITFWNDTRHVAVDPNINHPKEIDYAVRLINSLVPPEYKLEFIDMQPAIEPDGKLRL